MTKLPLRNGDVVLIRGVVTDDGDPKVRVWHQSIYADFLDIVAVEKADFQVEDEVVVNPRVGTTILYGPSWRGVILWLDDVQALVRPTEAIHNGRPSLVEVSDLTRAPEIETAEIVPLCATVAQ